MPANTDVFEPATLESESPALNGCQFRQPVIMKRDLEGVPNRFLVPRRPTLVGGGIGGPESIAISSATVP